MDGKKKYTKADFDNYTAAVKKECELTLLKQRERIDELRAELSKAERKISEYESQKDLVYKAITVALKKADDIERVSLIKYNQEIAQLKSFHDKWMGYFNKIIEKYPLGDELVAASKVNGKIAEVLGKTGDIDAQFLSERERLMDSLDDEDDESTSNGATTETDLATEAEQAAARATATGSGARYGKTADGDYADRSPAGFSLYEAMHPKQDLKDIMQELGVLIDD